MKIKNDIEFLGLDYKKEMLKFLIPLLLVFILAFAGAYFTGIVYLLLLPIVTIGIEGFILCTHYSNKKKEYIVKSQEEFVSLLSYFEVFIANNLNVYHSFESLIPYCSKYMKSLIENLLHEIDSDKTIQPYVNFSHKFSSNIFESIMLSIYQMVENGEDVNYLTQFDMIFNQISLNDSTNKIARKNSELDTANMFPLVGSGIVTVILLASILTIVGDYINVM